MSVVDRRQVKITLQRSGADSFWSEIRAHFMKKPSISTLVRRRRWRYLAMLALRENAGWPLDAIGEVFGHPKGHIPRCLARIKQELRDTFQMSPEYLGLDEEPDVDPGPPAETGRP